MGECMNLVNLQVNRVILHEVFLRGDAQKLIEPEYGAELENLNQEATDALRDRIVSAMASPARCVPMTITKIGLESMMGHVKRLVDGDDVVYINASKGAARKLAEEQKSRSIPGGVIVVFSGSAGVPSQRMVGIIKAEVHNGFLREKAADGKATLKFLKNLMLTAQTKLYKIGLFLEVNPDAPGDIAAGWAGYLYDETLTVANKYDAAQYFYEGFLGFTFPESSARQTKQFHDLTKGFIQSMNLPEEDKITMHNALVTYLKADQKPTVGIVDFAFTYFGDDVVQEAYRAHMISGGFPENAVNKDTTDVDRVLRMRRLTFRNKVRVIAPAEDFEKFVTFELIDGEPNVDGTPTQWTKVIIKDRIAKQE